MAEILQLGAITPIYADTLKRAREEREKLLTAERPRIFKKYGAVSDDDVYKILAAEKELDLCNGCDGENCRHRFATKAVPIIKVKEENFGDVNQKLFAFISYRPCEMAKAKAKQKKYQRNFQSAKLPPQYVNKTFAEYKVDGDNKAAVQSVKEFVKNPTGGLFLYGKPGTGKTFLASILTQEILKQGKSGIFGDVPSLLEDLRSSYESNNDSKISKLMDALAETDLLVLDDLGTENVTEWAVERLYLIVNQRYNAEKPILVTSNYRLGEIAERLNNPKKANRNFSSVTGDRIVSRLAQMCKRVELTGRDRRLGK